MDNAVGLIVRASDFAARAHRKQRRRDEDATPYINHPIGVAKILIEARVYDTDVIVAAILHHIIGDTDVTFEKIRSEFGEKICSIVAEVTENKLLPKRERKRLELVNASKFSREAKLVKLADKLYNLRDLIECPPFGWPDERIKDYCEWAACVVGQLSGVNRILELELALVLARKDISIPPKKNF